jgi:hypothetical protein
VYCLHAAGAQEVREKPAKTFRLAWRTISNEFSISFRLIHVIVLEQIGQEAS